VELNWHLGQPRPHPVTQSQLNLTVHLEVLVENKSMRAATVWGVALKSATDDNPWYIKLKDRSRMILDGVCVHGERSTLLPYERNSVAIQATSSVGSTNSAAAVRHYLRQLKTRISVSSQDSVSDEVLLDPESDRLHLDKELTRWHLN